MKRARVNWGWGSWTPDDPGDMDMYSSFEDGSKRENRDIIQTITHEFGHIFGLDDAYEDDEYTVGSDLRPSAYDAKIVGIDDVMFDNHHTNAIISRIDIQMIIEAFRTGESQFYLDYDGNKKSTGTKECNH